MIRLLLFVDASAVSGKRRVDRLEEERFAIDQDAVHVEDDGAKALVSGHGGVKRRNVCRGRRPSTPTTSGAAGAALVALTQGREEDDLAD
jgi:hypothetical protein